MLLPAPIQDLINAFSQLPGIGPKSASRLTFYLLTAPDELSQDLAAALISLKTETTYCQTCFNITVTGQVQCEICSNSDRDQDVICVVEEPLDVLALERTDGFHGRYHVLQGALSPIEGIGPDDLKIRELLTRVDSENIGEIILATNPSLEGDRCNGHVFTPAADTIWRANHPLGKRPAGRRRPGICRPAYTAESVSRPPGDGRLTSLCEQAFASYSKSAAHFYITSLEPAPLKVGA
jgi:recombination protein RecR